MDKSLEVQVNKFSVYIKIVRSQEDSTTFLTCVAMHCDKVSNKIHLRLKNLITIATYKCQDT